MEEPRLNENVTFRPCPIRSMGQDHLLPIFKNSGRKELREVILSFQNPAGPKTDLKGRVARGDLTPRVE
ncbi:MAG: hypothetical protein A2157_10920 [Deltaproteobacteria bacterium RBG_16_47_11]|nr:MAG: hypothetical protein A2157_10920 [Deltaproteobacteria bacterium RBG_16_47_11]